jgi:hypothetical protein
MDKDTRNQIQRATQQARSLLEQDYAAQLEGVYDIRPDGTIAPEPGAHLDATQRVIRRKLLAAIGHQQSHFAKTAEAVDAYLREAAFTTLNRFVALKMLEARSLVQECISRGEQSSGFKEFTGLAPGLVQLPDHGYRLYIECLFDEIGREVKVLFDRTDPASLLWLRRQALNDLLAILNADNLAGVWGEDETIGWVYQYFNSDEERKQMRAESQAPRNSRELAVRNQFFTPRYVVEFLTDNTLGRIWYEMRQGDTRLVEECDYLVRRPSEVFLAACEAAPEEPETEEDLSQEELLKKTAYIPFRAKKDPRDLKILDPACGSGHFLLYTFDLLLTIYEEGWADELAPVSEVTERTLRLDYSTLEELRASVPGLILRHNLHGIDIDHRAAQIASLALWMRAQRAYNDFDIPRKERLPIRKTNVVVAEPMPGDSEQLEEFAASLDKQLGQLIRKVFRQMELAGEAGSLLKIEEEIQSAVREIYPEFGGMYQTEDEERWLNAEANLLESLRTYSEQAQNGKVYQRRLFAEDSERGFAFIDVCRQIYDVVLMNPPFGDVSSRTKDYISNRYLLWTHNILCAFIERGCLLAGLPVSSNFVGIVCDRTINIKSTYERFRREFLLGQTVGEYILDLGWNVLDANVEVSSYVLSSREHRTLLMGIDLRQSTNKKQALINNINLAEQPNSTLVSVEDLRNLPNAVLGYYFPHFAIRIFSHFPPLKDCEFVFFEGHTLKSDRYFRFYWEIPGDTELNPNSAWFRIFNGTPYSRYYFPLCDAIPYGQNGDILAADTGTVLRNIDKHLKYGICFGKRGEFLDAQLLPTGFVSTVEGKACNVKNEENALILLALLNSRLFQFIINLYCGQHKYSGYVELFPYVQKSGQTLAKLAEHIVSLKHGAFSLSEKSPWFSGYQDFLDDPGKLMKSVGELEIEISSIEERINQLVYTLYELSECDQRIVEDFCSREPKSNLASLVFGTHLLESDIPYIFFHWFIGLAFGHHRVMPNGEVKRKNFFEEYPHLNGKYFESSNTYGILVDDEGSPDDIFRIINQTILSFQDYISNISSLFETGQLREWLRQSAFDFHLKIYSIGKRRAPIFWVITPQSSNYSIWLYYHRLTKDTFYKVSEFAQQKLLHEETKLTSLTQDAGPNPSSSQRKDIAAQEAFVAELRAFRDEVAIIAPLWNPNLNDGVIINFAPLWRLVPHHKAWQKECKDCWDKLVAGDYDWAYLAMHLWPERVVPKCMTDRSLAIAHGLEDEFWQEDSSTGKWQPRKVSKAECDRLIQERTSPAVKDALKKLLSAPAPGGASKTRSRRKRS